MSETALQTDLRNIVVDETVPHSPAVIWRALTDRDLIGRWLMAPRGFTPVVGTEFTYQTSPGGAWDGVIHCRVLEVVAERRLAYAWKGGHPDNVSGYGAPLDTIVSFTLSAVDGGTRVQVVHSGFALPRNEGAFRNMGDGWRKIVPRLGGVAGEA